MKRAEIKTHNPPPIAKHQQRTGIEQLEPRVLLSGTLALNPAFGYGGVTPGTLDKAAGFGRIAAYNPQNSDVYVVGQTQADLDSLHGNNIQEFTSTGTVVNSFGDNGLVTADSQRSVVQAAVQNDGKLLLLSQTNNSSTDGDIFVTRYTTAGTLDTTFASGGSFEFPNSFANYHSLIAFDLLPSGKIAVAYTTNINTITTTFLKMLNADGMLNSAFGTNGTATGAPGVIKSITTDPQGRYIATGSIYTGTSTSIGMIERFTASGQLDTSFATQGQVIASNQTVLYFAQVNADGIETAGRSLEAGTTSIYLTQINYYTDTGATNDSLGSGTGSVLLTYSPVAGSAPKEFEPDGQLLVTSLGSAPTLIRVNTDGSIDTTFSTAGSASSTVPVVTTTALEPDGSIIVADADTAGNYGLNFTPARLLPNGDLDSSFDSQRLGYVGPSFQTIQALAETSDGKTLALGSIEISGVQGSYIRRFNSDGSLDSTFAPGLGYSGQSGYVFIDITNPDKISVDATGNIYVDEPAVGIAKFTPSGAVYLSYGIMGVAHLHSEGHPYIQPDGRILVAIDDKTITRLNPSGLVDSQFGSGGTVTFPFDANSVTVQNNGDILVGGAYASPYTNIGVPSGTVSAANLNVPAVMRLNPDGTPDTTFGTNAIAIVNSLPAEQNLQSGDYYGVTAEQIAVQPDGTIIWAGNAGQGKAGVTEAGVTLAEFLSTGQPKTSFGTGGQTPTYLQSGGDQSFLTSLFLQADGTLIIQGVRTIDNSPSLRTNDVFVLHYDDDGTVIDSFTTTVVGTEVGDLSLSPGTTVAAPNGTIITGGGLAYTANTEPKLANITTGPHVVYPSQTTTTISLSATSTSIQRGQSDLITATVEPGLTGGVLPTGTVTLYQDGNTLGTVAIQPNGTATFQIQPTTDGTLQITALYSGDANFAFNSPIPLAITTAGLPATVLLNLANTSIDTTQAVQLTATVTGNDLTPTGEVTFYANGTSIGTATLQSNGQATLKYYSAVGGAQHLTVSYSGDDYFSANSSPPVTLTVVMPPVSTIIAKIKSPKISATLISGQILNLQLPVALTNTGASLNGNFTVNLYLNTHTTLDSNQILLNSSSSNLLLAKGKSKTINLIFGSLPTGLSPANYSLLVEVVDPSNAQSLALLPTTLNIVSPSASSAESAFHTTLNPSAVSDSRTNAKVQFEIKNGSNIPVKGESSITLFLSTDGITADGLSIRTVNMQIALNPNQSRLISLPLINLPAIPNGDYNLIAAVTDANGVSSQIVSPAKYTLTAPFTSLTPSFVVFLTKGPDSAPVGGIVTLLISNCGNIASKGLSTITVYATNDGVIGDGFLIYTAKKTLPIPPGKSRTFQILEDKKSANEAVDLGSVLVQVIDPLGKSQVASADIH